MAPGTEVHVVAAPDSAEFRSPRSHLATSSAAGGFEGVPAPPFHARLGASHPQASLEGGTPGKLPLWPGAGEKVPVCVNLFTSGASSAG